MVGREIEVDIEGIEQCTRDYSIFYASGSWKSFFSPFTLPFFFSVFVVVVVLLDNKSRITKKIIMKIPYVHVFHILMKLSIFLPQYVEYILLYSLFFSLICVTLSLMKRYNNPPSKLFISLQN